MKIQEICNSDLNLLVKFGVYCYKIHGAHPMYGEVILTLADLTLQ